MEKHYILYRTTNLITDQYYIGVHGQLKDDSYLGSGIHLRRQIEKYGRDQFSRSTLAVFATEAEAFAAEIKMLADHLGQPLCLNISKGGDGGANFNRLEGAAKARRDEKSRALLESRRRICPQCETEFLANYAAKIYCSKKCSSAVNAKIASSSPRSPRGSLPEERRKEIADQRRRSNNFLKSQTREEIAFKARRAAHNRWHVARNLVSDDCEFCDI